MWALSPEPAFNCLSLIASEKVCVSIRLELLQSLSCGFIFNAFRKSEFQAFSDCEEMVIY